MVNVVLEELFPYILIFCRLSGMFLFLPGLSAQYISPRIKIGLIFFFTLIIATLVPQLPLTPSLGFQWLVIIGKEIIVGLFFGLTAGFVMVVFEVAGAVASMSSSMGAAQMFNPSLGQQSNLISGFYSLAGLAIFFVSDLYLMLIQAVLQSVEIFPLMGAMPVADMVQHVILLFNQMFYVGVRMAAPMMLVSFIFTLSLAMLNRLMPTLQVFFIGLPAQISIGFVVIAMSLSTVVRIFIETFHTWYSTAELI